MKERIAVYPGTFDPITLGHMDVIKRSLALFDKVIIAVVDNPQKKHCFFSKDERLKMAKDATGKISNAEVDSFSGLLVDYLKRKNAKIIIRGLRAISDFEYEFQQAIVNRKLANNGIETVFIMTSPEYFYLNSTLIKELAHLRGKFGNLVPKNVALALKKKFRE
ncbi:MAG: pantetheine-phosphate adenylyltransferase [Candidatus Diapherotrites archaeon]|nr:pantetheine-phosphate adenylyltransferase [Candidatus Diapherotrites archaeon]